MRLVDNKETYEHILDIGDGEKNPVFEMKRLTSYEVDQLDDNNTLTLTDTKKSGEVRFLAGTVRNMKINYAVIGFVKNIEDKNGKLAKCTRETKRDLPPRVRDLLVKHIDEKNELIVDKEKEDKKVKN